MSTSGCADEELLDSLDSLELDKLLFDLLPEPEPPLLDDSDELLDALDEPLPDEPPLFGLLRELELPLDPDEPALLEFDELPLLDDFDELLDDPDELLLELDELPLELPPELDESLLELIILFH